MEIMHQLLSRQILDVRSYSEFLQGHLPGAIHMPAEQLLDRYADLCPSLPYTVVCDHGVSSIIAAEFLQSKGFDALDFPGGMSKIETRPQAPKITHA